MSILKNLGNKAMSTAKVVGSKSQEMVEVGKLKIQINQLESDITKLKTEIGEIVYNAQTNEQELDEEQIVSLCNNINAKYSEIEGLKEKIQEVKNS